MRLVDLTLPFPDESGNGPTVRLERKPIAPKDCPSYFAEVFHFRHDSMVGTYVDFPGHIEDTHDGVDAANAPLADLFRVDATVIHLDRADGSGVIGVDELRGACDGAVAGRAVIVNALGRRRFDEIVYRSVYLGADAVGWLVDSGVHILVSDVYESDDRPQRVFESLFAAGALAVCNPVNLHELTAPRVKLTVLPLRVPLATQLPCRVVAEAPE